MTFPETIGALDAVTALRVLCGAFLLPHTFLKLWHLDKAIEFFDKIRFRPPRFFVFLTATMEAIAAVGLIFNLYPKLGASIAATILFVAAWAQAKVNGLSWRWQFKGVEYMLFWAFACLAVGFLG
ncbi:MAG TPA: DoxX family protein [Gammaproteobacteria bacterium]|jgi:putative oxidoreductase